MQPIICSLLFLSISSGGIFTLTSAVDTHQARCTITEGLGIKVDSCDASQLLSCQAGRCMCNDIGNQIYDYHLQNIPEKVNSRNKRGLKKKIAAGVAGGAVGYVAAKAVSKTVSGPGGSSRQSKLTKVYSCYGRVGSMCKLDYNNVNIVTLPTTPATTTTTSTVNTTTEVPNTTIPTNSTELSNVTTATPSTSTLASVTTSQTESVDITKLPKCIRHAVCTPQNKASAGSGGHIVKSETDPRIGTCVCEPGYKVTTTDRCEKSGSMQITSSIILIFYALVIAKYF